MTFVGVLPDEILLPADGGEDLDVSHFLLDAVQALNIDFEVAGSIANGTLNRTMDGASTLSVDVADPTRTLTKSKIWDYSLEVDISNQFYRLAQVTKSNDILTLVFEDRIVAWMRTKKKPLKASRKHMTRAEFIKKMVDEIEADNKAHMPIAFFSPELHKKQPTGSTKKVKEKARRARRQGGLYKTVQLKIKGTQATGGQIENLQKALDVAVDLNAPAKVMIVMVMVGIQESSWTNSATNGSHVGIFQQDPAYWPATRTPGPDAKAFLQKAIAQDKAHPSFSLASLGESVQLSGQGSLYAQWEREARKIVEEYGIGPLDSGSSVERTYFEQFTFSRGKPGGPKGENSWEAGLRLAEEVRWRLFVVGNTVYYVADRDLIHSKPVATISEATEEIHSIDWDWDTGKKINEATVMCDAGRWFSHPGEVIVLEDEGPANGRWLVSRIERGLFDLETTITLRRLQAPKKEPAPTIASTQKRGDAVIQGGTIDGKSVRERIVNAARQARKLGPSKYHYAKIRPMPNSLFQKGIIRTDCSGFATLCYKAAGAADPNGLDYNGQGWTGTLMSHGHKTTSPAPGDLAMYNDHVAVYLGNGEIIGMGGDPDPSGPMAVHYRADFIGYYTYDFAGPGPVQGFSQQDNRSGGQAPKAGH